METLESSRVCRLCGKHSGILINMFDKNENHLRKINAILPIMVHEMDLLPKHMCHRCSYKLEEFHKFYVDCLKTDANLKSQLSWMQKEDSKERVGVPMVHIENIKIKVEPSDYDMYGIVNNVDYINSMSSVTFPVNGVQSNDIPDGITYAAYAQCGCYCDKADQSNQTLSSNYENRISRCSDINDVRLKDDRCADKLETVKTNLLADTMLVEQTNLVQSMDKSKDSTTHKSTSSFSPSNSRSNRISEQASSDMIVHNLRPRKGSIDYVGTKKKLTAVSVCNQKQSSKNVETKISASTEFSVRQVKTEKLDDFSGRILRPRKENIYYIEPKQKYSKSPLKRRRLQNHEYRLSEMKVRNIASKLKSPTKSKLLRNRTKVAVVLPSIKEEQLSDLDDIMFEQSVSATVLSLNSTGDLAAQIDPLSDVNVQNDRINCGTFNRTQHNDNFRIAKWKALRRVSKRKYGDEKGIDGISLSRYLRSQDLSLRNGKVRKFDGTGRSPGKLRRSLRNLSDGNLMKAFKDSVKVNEISASMKSSDIKHYCEECNTSFVNKELFKLHACYGH